MKTAYLWIAMYDGRFFGADLYFSSLTKFEKVFGRLKPGDGVLVPVKVLPDFTDWDYIPDNY